MRYFYLDTSTSYLYSGIVEDDKLLGEIQLNLNKDLSSFAMDEIAKLFIELKLEPNDIDKIIVVNGPGSFTGIRVGVTIAKMFAWTMNKEITTISSLEAMAASAPEEYDFVVPIIDARRGFVYGAIYNNKEQLILKDQYLRLETLETTIDSLPGDFIVITNDEIELKNEYTEYNPDILKIVKRYGKRKSINSHLVEPNYLKLTEAEENKNRD